MRHQTGLCELAFVHHLELAFVHHLILCLSNCHSVCLITMSTITANFARSVARRTVARTLRTQAVLPQFQFASFRFASTYYTPGKFFFWILVDDTSLFLHLMLDQFPFNSS